ncbi:MAG TPA: helix-turn-helix domain-containing protein [Anaeromyxobacter sp.]|nr:helix-turn-helix domain-containing protein [Anaeromyxobacter sp.]
MTAERALLLDDAPPAVVSALSEAGFLVIAVSNVEAGRTLLARGAGRFAVVDGRIAAPCALDEEIRRRLDAFFDRLRQHEASGLYAAVMREVERPLIAGALARANGVRAAAAEALGIDRGTLARRMRALGMDGDET